MKIHTKALRLIATVLLTLILFVTSVAALSAPPKARSSPTAVETGMEMDAAAHVEQVVVPTLDTDPEFGMLKDIHPGSADANPGEMVNYNGTLFFSALDATHGYELWKSDGTVTGTVLFKNINPAGNSSPTRLTVVGDTLFFRANDGTHGEELWMSDGTVTGTVLVKDLKLGSDSSLPDGLTAVNGTLFFRCDDGTHGSELWKSDGTAAGTILVKDIYPGPDIGNPVNLTNMAGTLFFSAHDGSHGAELWKSDGTEVGTVMVKDISPAGGFASPGGLTPINGTLFFAAHNATYGTELWKSDGTEAGTVLVKDINPGSFGSGTGNLTNVNGTLFFSAEDKIWKSDGTDSGTVMVKDPDPSGIAYIESLTPVDETLFFSAKDQLWKSDGTESGTVMVKDMDPDGYSRPYNLTDYHGTLYFRSTDGVHGWELWKSDGTEAGTVLVKDINPSGDSHPTNLTVVNNLLFFDADDNTHGNELWAPATTRVFAGQVTDGLGNPVPDAQLTLRQGGTVRLTVTTDMSGKYRFIDPANGADISIRVTLQESAETPSAFRIRYGLNNDLDAPPVIYAETAPFTLTTDHTVTQNIDFRRTTTLTTAPGIPKARLDDLAVIYYHTWQSAQLAHRHSLVLDYQLPVDVYAYATNDGGNVAGSCYWNVSVGNQPYIVLGVNKSDKDTFDSPGNREWHEFGHHVMADVFGNDMPSRPAGDTNHGGYRNSKTVDSWAEGWAEFWSLMVAAEISGTARPGFYRYAKSTVNLELNTKAWEDEEFAVAGMLWDLYDGLSITDTTTVTPTGTVSMTLTDNIDLTGDQILDILTHDCYTTFNATADGYLQDVLAVYSATISNTVRYGYTVTDVNHIFIAHGLYNDANSDKSWQEDERVGQCTDGTRPARRNKPPRLGSYVAYTATELDSGSPLTVTEFLVSVMLEPPFEAHSYVYTVHAEETADLLYAIAPPAEYPATVSITPLLPSYQAVAPLTYTPKFYWEQMAMEPEISFLEYIFVLAPERSIYLPLIVRN